jgi:peptidoglycan/LPS O-acetylase OafA/YrhL
MKREYYGNLDTIRCLAAFFVVAYHWLPASKTNPYLGEIGVDIFFVLSGFLITEILLRSKKQAEGDRSLRFKFLQSFYVKRALRIFPIYFIFVTFFFLLNDPALGFDWLYVFTYTTNFLLFFKRIWIHPISHTWSLSVEEQFYIIWPFLILFARKAWQIYLILSVIVVSWVFIAFASSGNPFFFMLPVSCMSTLGIGALLAYLKNSRENSFVWTKRYFLPATLVGILVFVLLSGSANFITRHIVLGTTAFAFIGYAVTSESRFFNKVFSNRITSYLGRISYGIYLYHVPTPWLVRNLNGTEDKIVLHIPKLLPVFHNGYVILLENLVVLLTLSTLSWYLVERPIKSAKKILPSYKIPALSLYKRPE